MWLQDARGYTMTDVGTLQMCCLWAQALVSPVQGAHLDALRDGTPEAEAQRRVESGLDTCAIEAAGNADAEERVKKGKQVAFLNALGFAGLACRLAALIRIGSGSREALDYLWTFAMIVGAATFDTSATWSWTATETLRFHGGAQVEAAKEVFCQVKMWTGPGFGMSAIVIGALAWLVEALQRGGAENSSVPVVGGGESEDAVVGLGYVNESWTQAEQLETHGGLLAGGGLAALVDVSALSSHVSALSSDSPISPYYIIFALSPIMMLLRVWVFARMRDLPCPPCESASTADRRIQAQSHSDAAHGVERPLRSYCNPASYVDELTVVVRDKDGLLAGMIVEARGSHTQTHHTHTTHTHTHTHILSLSRSLSFSLSLSRLLPLPLFHTHSPSPSLSHAHTGPARTSRPSTESAATSSACRSLLLVSIGLFCYCLSVFFCTDF